MYPPMIAMTRSMAMATGVDHRAATGLYIYNTPRRKSSGTPAYGAHLCKLQLTQTYMLYVLVTMRRCMRKRSSYTCMYQTYVCM